MKRFFITVSALIFPMLAIACVSANLIPFLVTDTPDNDPDASPEGCTIFTVTDGETTYFGGNLDYRKEGPIIVGIAPPTASDYGAVKLGFQKGETQNYEMAMNDQGLAWDINSVPGTALNRHPERPYSGWGTFLSAVTRKTSTVEEVIRLAAMFDLGDALKNCQFHVADATGDAVVIGPGPDGEIAFTRMANGEHYLVSTNFNRAIPSEANHPETYLRYDNAVAMLENPPGGTSLTADYLGSVLEASHFESFITYTLYSYVFDTKDKTANVYYLSDFNNAIRIDFADAFAQGPRWFPITDLFPEHTIDKVEAKYTGIVTRDVITMAIIMLSLATVLAILILLLIRSMKTRKAGRPTKQERLPASFLFALASSCGFLGVLMFISHIYPPNIISLMRPDTLYRLSIALSVAGFLAFAAAISVLVFHKRKGGDFRINSPRGLSPAIILAGIPGLVAFGYLTVEATRLFRLF